MAGVVEKDREAEANWRAAGLRQLLAEGSDIVDCDV